MKTESTERKLDQGLEGDSKNLSGSMNEEIESERWAWSYLSVKLLVLTTKIKFWGDKLLTHYLNEQSANYPVALRSKSRINFSDISKQSADSPQMFVQIVYLCHNYR